MQVVISSITRTSPQFGSVVTTALQLQYRHVQPLLHSSGFLAATARGRRSPAEGTRVRSPVRRKKRVPRRLEWMSMPGLEGSDYRQNGFASACVSVERTGPQVSSVEALDWDPLIAVVTHAHALALALANPFRRTKGARPTVGSHPRRTARNQKKGAGRPSARPHTAPQPYLRAASARPDPLCRPHTDRWRGAQ
jgi:hypothetical protein